MARKKIENEKYYTPKNVVKKVIELIEENIQLINDFDRIIEPSSGGGAFLKELPSKAIGYDIEPHYFNNVITGDYLQQNIQYMSNSLVIGNPPFDDGSNSNNLANNFIKKSISHSDYVVFVLPINKYKKDNIKEAELFKSYKLPALKYSGKSLKCCINFYRKREEERKIKKIDESKVQILIGKKDKKELEKKPNYIKEWLSLKSDYRFTGFGGLRLLKDNEPMKTKEFKIIFLDKKRNFIPHLEKLFKKKRKESISAPDLRKEDIITLIYDTYEDLRLN